MCFFIAGPRDKECRAPLKRGRDISYIFKPFCHTTITGHTLINTRGEEKYFKFWFSVTFLILFTLTCEVMRTQ